MVSQAPMALINDLNLIHSFDHDKVLTLWICWPKRKPYIQLNLPEQSAQQKQEFSHFQ